MLIHALRKEVTSGSRVFPLHVGFLPAKDILKIADAPAFTHNTEHEVIAKHILNPPVKEWQRPLNDTRLNNIATLYDHSGEFMPNPVLLAENVLASPHIRVQQQSVAGGTPTMVFDINVPEPQTGQPKPLWILDGQHRIRGLAISRQASNPIPFVLLLNAGGSFYSGPDLAKIFAQVTTYAEKLDSLHNAWLTYAFGLGEYDASDARCRARKQAMECASYICQLPQVDAGSRNNPFFNCV